MKVQSLIATHSYLEGSERSRWIMSAVEEMTRLQSVNIMLLKALKIALQEAIDWHNESSSSTVTPEWQILIEAIVAEGERNAAL